MTHVTSCAVPTYRQPDFRVTRNLYGLFIERVWFFGIWVDAGWQTLRYDEHAVDVILSNIGLSQFTVEFSNGKTYTFNPKAMDEVATRAMDRLLQAWYKR